ncbi:MAG: A24 family peptidase C-terminal domain-containing protein [Poseidonia sp.]
MEATNEAILGWTRVAVLLLGMGWAAWMDHQSRRVANEHWIVWAKPAIFIWALDLMVQGADVTIYLTAAAVVAYASVSVFGRPTIKDALNGSWMDRTFLLWYAAGAAGVVAGAFRYQATTPVEVLLDNGDALGMLWWRTAALFLVIFFIDVAWRLRLLHGGADAKALMWVSLVFPTWASVPLPFEAAGQETVVALPVSISLLIWGGLAFLFIPFIMLALNITRGDVKRLGDLRMAWHASMLAVDEVAKRHVWLLTDTMEMPTGEHRVVHAARAPRSTPTAEELEERLRSLKGHGVDRVWVSHKMPLLVFLFPAVLPLVLFGDPTTLLLQWIG